MNSGTWISIYMPLFILFFIVLPQHSASSKRVIIKIKRRRGVKIMMNEILKKYIGMNCQISTGSLGTNLVGKIINVDERWIEVETKAGEQVINSEFVQSIKIMKAKKK
ncbi:hypothetical protein [Clostridium grantii]|uniref:Preprotein translocase subunit YajC n=1 Tax=Clostridium grantii DSM 8605 TaxID=1121316 RepID=A0A1M5VLJ3_9CLOT|nr:hypothetical protein [Clostridium grantii]SHH75924.1 hypothetical protein SAMN02745207_02327 [Clostridium grantii DSM 8605]